MDRKQNKENRSTSYSGKRIGNLLVSDHAIEQTRIRCKSSLGDISYEDATSLLCGSVISNRQGLIVIQIGFEGPQVAVPIFKPKGDVPLGYLILARDERNSSLVVATTFLDRDSWQLFHGYENQKLPDFLDLLY